MRGAKPRENEFVRPTCGCGKPVMRKGYTKNKFPIWATSCGNCRYFARKQKKSNCEKCGTTGELHVDHIDGNRSNNKLSNLQTLCSKCHWEKTIQNGDYKRNEALLSM